jgi:hypothetical protein
MLPLYSDHLVSGRTGLRTVGLARPSLPAPRPPAGSRSTSFRRPRQRLAPASISSASACARCAAAPAPSSRVVAVTKASHFRPIQYSFNASAKSAGCFRFCGPERFYNLHHQTNIDKSDRELSENGRAVGVNGVRPLRCMLHVSPSGTMGLDIRSRTIVERHRFFSG